MTAGSDVPQRKQQLAEKLFERDHDSWRRDNERVNIALLVPNGMLGVVFMAPVSVQTLMHSEFGFWPITMAVLFLVVAAAILLILAGQRERSPLSADELDSKPKDDFQSEQLAKTETREHLIWAKEYEKRLAKRHIWYNVAVVCTVIGVVLYCALRMFVVEK